LEGSAERVFTQYESDPGYRIVHDDLDDMSRVSSGATYQKGSWILHMLRGRMGDEAFWAGIRAYYARYMNQNATTSDFQAAMEQASGLDLQTFFDQWLRDGGNPKLQGWWDYDVSARAVRIELNQTQTVGPMFEIPLEIGIYQDGQVLPTTIERVDLDGGFHRFVIPVDAEPTDVRLDPNSWTLFEADFGRQGR
jgi:aminopeptidase N